MHGSVGSGLAFVTRERRERDVFITPTIRCLVRYHNAYSFHNQHHQVSCAHKLNLQGPSKFAAIDLHSLEQFRKPFLNLRSNMSSTTSSGAQTRLGTETGTGSRLPQRTVSEKDISEKPWKFIGYPGFASFISSDDDLVYFRKFGTLHSRVLLTLQDDIVQLEQALDELDRKAITMQLDRHNGSFRQDCLHFQERTALISNIHQKLKEYSEFSSHDKLSMS